MVPARQAAHGAALVGCLAFFLLLLAGPVGAIQLSGSARLYAGPVEVDDQREDQLDQKYRVSLQQALTPLVRMAFHFRLNDFQSSPEAGATFRRQSREPQLQLTYDRPVFSARLLFQDRALRTTNEVNDLDLETYLGQFEWRPRRGPRFSLRLQEDTNVAVEVFGRRTDSRLVELSALYDRTRWGARYSFRRSEIESRLTSFRLDEDRHELRLDFADRFWSDRLFVSANLWLSEIEQLERAPDGTTFDRPLSPRQGLAAVDTSPEVGELEPQPALIDGDLTSPVLPRIEIGAANTFRNLGLDLGLTRQVSQLEITVDAPSDPGLLWRVYQSSDNLSWTAVPAASAVFDDVLLRYVLRFPETTGRYFKAVNVSANSFPEVAVTEIRALVEVDRLGREEGDATTYQAGLFASYDPHRRLGFTLTANARNTEDLVGGRLSQELDEFDYRGEARVGLAAALDLRVSYRFADLEESLDPTLQREEEEVSGSLEWTPLPTVETVLTATQREEREDELLIRAVDTVRLRALTELLPDLRLTSEVSWSRVDDPFAGFEQTSWRWLETVEARPTENWTLDGVVSYTSFDSTGTVTLSRRSNLQLRTSWRVTPFLTLNGDWDLADDDRQETLTQRYGVFWAPGPRLNAALTWEDTETEQLRQTTISTLSLNYRLQRWITMWATVTRSTFEQAEAADTETNTLRVGLNLFF